MKKSAAQKRKRMETTTVGASEQQQQQGPVALIDEGDGRGDSTVAAVAATVEEQEEPQPPPPAMSLPDDFLEQLLLQPERMDVVAEQARTLDQDGEPEEEDPPPTVEEAEAAPSPDIQAPVRPSLRRPRSPEVSDSVAAACAAESKATRVAMDEQVLVTPAGDGFVNILPLPAGNEQQGGDEEPARAGDDVVAIVVGDTHFSPTRSDETDVMAANTIRLAQRMGAKSDFLVMLGDLLDRFNMKALREATEWLWELQKHTRVVLLVGNHDYLNCGQFCSTDHPFHAIARWENVTVVSTPTVLTFNGQRFLFVPYVPDGRLDEALRLLYPVDIEAGLADIACTFAHQTIYGAQMNGLTSSTGDRWPAHRPLMVSGHIHEYHRLQENMVYAGSAYQIKFGEPEDNAVLIMRFRTPAAPIVVPFQRRLRVQMQVAGASATHPLAGRWQFQRVRIKVPVKRSVRMTVEQLEGYVHTPQSGVGLTRITVAVKKNYLLATKQSSTVKELLKNPHVVIVWDVEHESVNAIAAIAGDEAAARAALGPSGEATTDATVPTTGGRPAPIRFMDALAALVKEKKLVAAFECVFGENAAAFTSRVAQHRSEEGAENDD